MIIEIPMFVPSTESAYDTSYFMSRYIWNPEEHHIFGASDFDDMSESGSDSCSSGSFSNVADEDVSSIFRIIILLCAIRASHAEWTSEF